MSRRPARRRASVGGRFRLPPSPAEHLAALKDSLHRLEGELDRLGSWGERLAGRLLAVARWAWPAAVLGFVTVVAVFLAQGLYDPMRPLFKTVGLTASCWMADCCW